MRRNAGMDPHDRSGLSQQPSLPADRFSDFERAELARRLDRLAEVRAGVVVRGKKLVADPQYPDRRIIRRVGRILANHLAT